MESPCAGWDHMLSAVADRWEINADASRVTFKVRHLIVSSTKGHFKRFRGHVLLDEADHSRSAMEAEVEVSSVDTDMRDRDEALRGRDFFDAERFPLMTFKSTYVTVRGRSELLVSGELQLKSVRRALSFEVQLQPARADGRRRAKAVAHLSRKDWNLVFSPAVETGGLAVGDRVDIELDVELVRKK